MIHWKAECRESGTLRLEGACWNSAHIAEWLAGLLPYLDQGEARAELIIR